MAVSAMQASGTAAGVQRGPDPAASLENDASHAARGSTIGDGGLVAQRLKDLVRLRQARAGSNGTWPLHEGQRRARREE